MTSMTQDNELLNQLSRLGSDSPDPLNVIKQVVDYMPMAISITDLKGKIQYVNDFFSEMTGYSDKEILGKNSSLLSYKTTPEKIYAQLWKSISEGNIWQGHLVNRTKDNKRYLAEIKIIPIKGTQDDIVFYLSIQKDVSESHVSTTLQGNQDKMISGILNTMPSALALINEQQEIVLDNLSYKTLGTDIEAEPTTLVLEQIKQSLSLDVNTPLSKMTLNKHQRFDIALTQKYKTRWFACRLFPLEMLDSDIEQFFDPQSSDLLLLTMTEFTNEKQRAERQRITQLQKMTSETEMLHAMQETMHGVLHQLQGPVNLMDSAVQMLNARGDCCTGLQPLNMALEAGNLALKELRNALPERTPEAKQSTNVNQIIHELSQMATDKILQHSIDLKLCLTATLPSVIAQPARLRMAFKKILDNAIDSIVFNRCNEREILITTAIENDGITIDFEDSGCGIPKADRLKVFQPFFTTKPACTEGTRGIGLCIVQQIMNEHSGTVAILSTQLAGSRVSVFIPKY